jgi:two-component system, LytTR family, sensor kinase
MSEPWFRSAELAFERPLAKWFVFVIVWTLVGVFFSTRWYFIYKGTTTPMSWMESLILGLIEWYLWALISLVVFRLCRRFPLDTAGWRQALPVLAISAVIIVPFQIIVYTCIHVPIDAYFMSDQPSPIQRTLWSNCVVMLKSKFHVGVLTFGLMTIASYTFLLYRKYREEELRASELKTQLVNAQLNTLRTQLHPHFLFNSLNAVSALMREDVEAAERMLMRLSDLLRLSLHGVGKQKVPLREEIEFVQRYLDVERMRFSDRLHVSLQIDPATADAAVPYLLLQPLVENAIRHGISPRPGNGSITVLSQHIGERLLLQVVDDGIGLRTQKDRTGESGVGLANTRERLQMLYGDDCCFSLSDTGAGVTVRIEIPFEVPTSS